MTPLVMSMAARVLLRFAKEFPTEQALKQYRGIAKVVKGLGGTLPAPIVLFRQGQPPYLVGGNTRLMASRAFGATPKVLAVHV